MVGAGVIKTGSFSCGYAWHFPSVFFCAIGSKPAKSKKRGMGTGPVQPSLQTARVFGSRFPMT